MLKIRVIGERVICGIGGSDRHGFCSPSYTHLLHQVRTELIKDSFLLRSSFPYYSRRSYRLFPNLIRYLYHNSSLSKGWTGRTHQEGNYKIHKVTIILFHILLLSWERDVSLINHMVHKGSNNEWSRSENGKGSN